MYYDPSTPRASTTPGLAAAPAASASADRLDPPNNGVPSGVAVEGAGGLLEAIAAFGQVLTGVDVAQAHPSQLYGLLQALATVTNQLNATQVAAVAAADRSGQWAVDRTRSLNTWVQLATRSSVAAAGTKIGAARVSTHIPETMAAFTSGDTTLEHVSMIARAATASPARVDVLSDLDPIVADLCTHVRPRQLGTALAEWSHRVDAITMTEEYATHADNAHLHISPTFGGMVAVNGILDPETGTALKTAIDATITHLRRTSSDSKGCVGSDLSTTGQGSGELRDGSAATAGPHLGEDLDNRPAGRPRRSVQNVAALRYLLAQILPHAAMPTAIGGLPVKLVVTASIESLRAELTDNGVAPADLNDTPIPAAVARRLACDCHVLPVIMNSKSQVLDVGRHTRLISPQLRLAITLRDTTCRFPQCDGPIQEIHHLAHWANGGPTTRENLAGLCYFHHKAIHDHGYELAGNANQPLTIRRP